MAPGVRSGFSNRGPIFWVTFFAIPILLTFAPTGHWSTPASRQNIDSRTDVRCTRWTWRLGLPLFGTYITWHEWTAVHDGGEESEATDAQVEAFIAKHNGKRRSDSRFWAGLIRPTWEDWKMRNAPREIAYTFRPFWSVGILAVWVYVQIIVLWIWWRCADARAKRRQ